MSPQLYHRLDEIFYSFISLRIYRCIAADVADCATATTDAVAAPAAAATATTRCSDYKTQPFLYLIVRSMVHMLHTARLNITNNI